MGSSLWFISILRDQPWLGFLIGLLFVTLMFASKNLVIYFYARGLQKKRRGAPGHH